MAVLEVVKAGHPILKEVAEPVEHVNKKMRALIEDMADTMYKTEVLDWQHRRLMYPNVL